MKSRSNKNYRRIGATVIGRVQGVGFRYFVRLEAARFGLTGWVCNLADGNVELEAQGAGHNVDSFLAEIEKGMPLAHVSEVRCFEMPVDTNEERFEIRH